MLVISATAYASDIQTLVGRAIEGTFAVQLSGEKLENKAIVIDGTSYLPVREIAEKMNLKVDFDMERGVILESNYVPPEGAGQVIVYPPSPPPEPITAPEKEWSIEELNKEIESQKSRIALNEHTLKFYTDYGNKPPEGFLDQIQQANNRLAELEGKLSEMTKVGG